MRRLVPRVGLRLPLAVVCCIALLSGMRSAAQSRGAGDRVIRVWGHGHRGQDYIGALLRAWEAGFTASHPQVRFSNELDGNASAIGGLFTSTADIALMDREASFIEVDAYQQGAGHDPFRIPVARGSVALRHHAPALLIYVNRANPIAELSIQQLDGIFDADHRLGERRYKSWGDLGLRGKWADKSIHLFSFPIESAEVQFFERAAMKGSQKFSCCLTLAKNRSVGLEEELAGMIAKDRFGLGLSTMPAPGLSAVPLRSSPDSPAVLPTSKTITDGTYPLARTVYMYVNRTPKASFQGDAADFLAFVISPGGQAIVARTGGYLPLSAQVAGKAKEALQ